MVAPALLWLSPGAPHSYGPDTAAGWTESWLLFDGPSTSSYEALGYLPAGVAVQPVDDPLPLVLVLMRLADTCRNAGTDMDVVAASLIHEFLVTSKRVVSQPGSNDERLLDGLRADALSDLSVGDRAARLGVSTRQLRNAVRRSAGCSPTELVDRVRVNRAKSLLAETSLPVTEVARAVGFGDPAYFSRHFRARAGMSPRAFRAQQQQFLS
jgi:AraC-like DNA-binding protein